MLYIGKHIIATDETVQPLSEQQLWEQIVHPQTELRQRIEQLRIVRTVDVKRYAILKRQLPFFVCATFAPPIRRIDHFAYIEYFVIDLDHISEKGFDLHAIKEQCMADERVRICFISPSADGLKLLFSLSERCYDYGMFSAFYKQFLQRFALQYGLEQIVDYKTCDVTRACFLSYDPNAYYNATSLAVHIDDYLTEQSLIENHHQPTHSKIIAAEVPSEPDQDAVARIKEILQIQKTKAEKPPVYVPDELIEVMSALQDYLLSLDFEIDEIKPIQYGQTIRCTLQKKKVECNLFYGKKGFTVVATPRTGTDKELNELMAKLIRNYLNK